MNDLKQLLERREKERRGRLIVVDGVFSMDGDLAPLREVVDLAKAYGARVMVDEAHGTGVVGASGRGSVEACGVEGEVDIVLGTFSKTFAATGGFIVSSREVVDYVRHYGRSYMFSASPIPVVAAVVLAGLTLVETEPKLRHDLWHNVRYFHRGLKAIGYEVFPDPPQSAIMTVGIGSDVRVREISKRIYEEGVFASTVAYPAVPRNQGKIRFSLSAAHTQEQLDTALACLARVGREFGIS